jgi:hypothetical protein
MRKKLYWSACFILVAMTLAAFPTKIHAQMSFEQVTGKEFEKAVPKDFYLEGNAIPVEVRNAALLKTGAARVLIALIDTTGYSSQIRQKYIGMLISEGSISVCGESVRVGSYGFGLEKPAETSPQDGKFYLYNQAGEKVVECNVKKDSKIHQPKPLQAVLTQGAPARLYLGRYWLELK